MSDSSEANNPIELETLAKEAITLGAAKKSPAAEELAAFNQIVSAISALPETARERVIHTALTFLGFRELSHSTPPQPHNGGHVSSHASGGSRPAFSEDRTPSPKEFLLEKKPATDVERIACLAYYLAHYRSTPHFKTLDLSKLNTDAAQIKLSNAAMAVDNASKGGLLVQAGKGMKQISAIGELYVQALPDRAAARDAIAHARPKRRTRKGNGVEDADS